MTIEEFDKQKWEPGMRATHKDQEGEFPISTVDFSEKLIGIKDFADGVDNDYVHWARCENITLSTELLPSFCDECKKPAFKIQKDATGHRHVFCEKCWYEHRTFTRNRGKPYGF